VSYVWLNVFTPALHLHYSKCQHESLCHVRAPLLAGTMSGAGATQRRVRRSSCANWRVGSAWTAHASSAACTSPRLQVCSKQLLLLCPPASSFPQALSRICMLLVALPVHHVLTYTKRRMTRRLAATAGAAERGARTGAIRAASVAFVGGGPRQSQASRVP
jgi:hypothetical protein